MQQNNLKREALEYHARERRGKVEVIPTKPYSTQRDLSLAYSPGVAEPCKAIAENPQDVYTYTAKGNLVAVISNGTAVLGLGDIGPEASKPVMEGKGSARRSVTRSRRGYLSQICAALARGTFSAPPRTGLAGLNLT